MNSKLRHVKIGHNLSELVPSFIEDRTKPSDPVQLSVATVRSYRLALRTFSGALASASYEEEIPALIRTVVDAKLGPNSKSPMSKSGMNVYLRALNSYLTWCTNNGFLEQDVKLALFKLGPHKRARVLTREETACWKRVCVNGLVRLRTKYMVLLILDTGLRAEECLTLKVADIDFQQSLLWVIGKGNKLRQVPLSETGKRLLRYYLVITDAHRETNDKEMVFDYSYVFCTYLGEKVSYRNSLRSLKQFGSRLRLPWIGWHTFRRTFGTIYLQNGGLLTDLQEIYGHEDVSTTLRYLGTSINEIVKQHERKSPLAQTFTTKRVKC